MKKLMNTAGTMLDESLDGFAAAHARVVMLGTGRQYVRRRTLVPGKVALVSGGGSGHEPMHVGFVGHGMLDAACPGQVFTSPTPGQITAARMADGHGGVGPFAGEEQRERKSDQRGSTDDYRVLPGRRDVVALQQAHDAERCARDVPGPTAHEASHRCLGQTVDILLGRYEVENPLRVEALGRLEVVALEATEYR